MSHLRPLRSTTSAQARAWDLRDGSLATAVVAAAALCWVLSVHRMQGMGMDMGPGSDLGSFSWFLPTWAIMMAAMMLPSALPAIVAFERTRHAQPPLARGIVFAAGYVAVWSVFGAGAYLVYRGLADAHPGVLEWDRGGRFAVAATAVAAGLYELTPLKRACLERCRTLAAGDGGGSPLAAALRYGADCIGCSLGLMVLLLVIGAMSITWMVVIAAVLVLQKLSAGPYARLATGLALVILGAWIAIDPGSVPGLTIPMTSMTSM